MFYFNDTLNTFLFIVIWHWTYGNESLSEMGKPLPSLHGLLVPISSNVHHPTDRIAPTMAFVTLVVEHWLDRAIARWVHHEGSIR